MNGLTESAANYAFATVGIAVLLLLLTLFAKMQKNSADQIKEMQINSAQQTKEMQETNFEQIQVVIKSTTENNRDTALLVAKTVGSEIAGSLSANLGDQKTVLTVINEKLVTLGEEIKTGYAEIKAETKERYEKNQLFNQKEFDRVFTELTKVEQTVNLVLANQPPVKSTIINEGVKKN